MADYDLLIKNGTIVDGLRIGLATGRLRRHWIVRASGRVLPRLTRFWLLRKGGASPAGPPRPRGRASIIRRF